MGKEIITVLIYYALFQDYGLWLQGPSRLNYFGTVSREPVTLLYYSLPCTAFVIRRIHHLRPQEGQLFYLLILSKLTV